MEFLTAYKKTAYFYETSALNTTTAMHYKIQKACVTYLVLVSAYFTVIRNHKTSLQLLIRQKGESQNASNRVRIRG